MKTMTKLFALGGLAAAGGTVIAAVRAKRRARAKHQQIDAFDYADLDEPVIVTEEIVVVSDTGPYEIEMELIPADQPGADATESTDDLGGPGREAGPR